MTNLAITTTSVIKRPNLRRVDVSAHLAWPAHLTMTVYEQETIVASCKFAIDGGDAKATLWLNLPARTFEARWVITDQEGCVVGEQISLCEKPREWTFYVMLSSHTDIGLHNSQYIQRYNSSRFVDMAADLCDATANRSAENQYRYVMEGTWFWNNYLEDRPCEDSKRIVQQYIKSGRLGVCAGVAGNHTHTYGFEELCRSTYSRKWLLEHGIDCKTMTMIDNNGLSWAMVQPYADAGYENIIFSPNHWNPLPSTVWRRDATVEGLYWDTEAGGGGARMDVKYDSHLPMLFWWESAYGQRLLVWASTQYARGGATFGLQLRGTPIAYIEEKMASQLAKLEKKYPYDIWFVVNYDDDQEPNLDFCNNITDWNNVYASPSIRLMGDPDEPFQIVRERFGDQIPTLRGDITGGWYQHPLSAAELLADKMNADRELANAEKIASLAALYGKNYLFPIEDFNRAWAALIMNDEHSYGTSGYQGRRVYETWIGHRDWIGKAAETASRETHLALQAIGANIPGGSNRVLLFNPTAQERNHKGIMLPPFGYRVMQESTVAKGKPTFIPCEAPPSVENAYYRIVFAPNGSIGEIFDKELGRSICNGNCNELLYTRDNHKSFHSPDVAHFAVSKGTDAYEIEVRGAFAELGAELVTTVRLPLTEKRIDIDNCILHARDMVNTDRYKRYLYYAFPFDVPNGKRICELGGCEAEYGADITGHGTDVYMAAHEYVCIDSKDASYGVGLVQLDSQLVEFDCIHPDKTDFANLGNGSAVYSYIANDWLQMHLPGGSALNYHFRYSIVSYVGTHRTAKLAQIAELLANPVYEEKIGENTNGVMPSEMSFLSTDARLVGLKPARDGNGLIARLYCHEPTERFETNLGSYQAVTVDERAGGKMGAGFATLRLSTPKIAVRETQKRDELDIGSVETGLITHPRAARGENEGMLYLLWGKCRSDKLAYYELWRDGILIAKVEPEDYVVGRYIDTGLEKNCKYTYRVRAIDKNGQAGAFSETFEAWTKE